MIAKVDKKGRVLIPKRVREAVGLSEDSIVRVRVEGDKIILEKVESAAEKYYGRFKVRRWPKDLDAALEEMLGRSWEE